MPITERLAFFVNPWAQFIRLNHIIIENTYPTIPVINTNRYFKTRMNGGKRITFLMIAQGGVFINKCISSYRTKSYENFRLRHYRRKVQDGEIEKQTKKEA